MSSDEFVNKLPVLIYFHGGAFIVGSNRDGPLQPEHLGLVVIGNTIFANSVVNFIQNQ